MGVVSFGCGEGEGEIAALLHVRTLKLEHTHPPSAPPPATQVLDEESLRDNFVIVYELLDEARADFLCVCVCVGGAEREGGGRLRCALLFLLPCLLLLACFGATLHPPLPLTPRSPATYPKPTKNPP